MQSFNKVVALAVGAVAGAVIVAVPVPANAAAIYPMIYPSSQSGASGTDFIWGGGWANVSGHHYKVTFTYGDGASSTIANTTAGSQGYDRTFVTCTGRVYTQKLTVTDLTVGGTESTTATTTVARGKFC
jgi:hypothetical protein